MESHRVPRRTFLKRAAVAGGAVAAAGAAGFGVRELFFGEDAPPTRAPKGVETRWPIKHVVYVMLENRSFNHIFGAFPGATDTTRVGLVDGKEQRLARAPEWFTGDLPHDRGAALFQEQGGKMDGFGVYDPSQGKAVAMARKI